MMTISSTELYEWHKYYMKEPFMSDRLELQLAKLTHIVANFAGTDIDINDLLISNKKKAKQVNKEGSLEEKLLKVFGG